jgi:hypothetical protein
MDEEIGCPSLASRHLEILGNHVLKSSRELQLLPFTKIVDFVTPLFLDPVPVSD